MRLGFRNRDRVVGAHMRASGDQRLGQTHRRGARNGVRVRLECQAQDAQFLVLHRVQRRSDFFDQAFGQRMIHLARRTEHLQRYAMRLGKRRK